MTQKVPFLKFLNELQFSTPTSKLLSLHLCIYLKERLKKAATGLTSTNQIKPNLIHSSLTY
jgi:hypothetical protein